jgi:DUF4097 and DUF4098 domain-containing protein YvlB
MSKSAIRVKEATLFEHCYRKMSGFHQRDRFWAMLLTATTVLSICTSLAAETRKEFRYTVGSGATVSIVNDNGTVIVKPSTSRQVSISTVLQSPKVVVESNQNGNRITARTHVLQKTTADRTRVDYEVSLPPDANISIDSGVGQIRVENMQGNVNIEADDANVDIAGVNNGNLQIQTVNGKVNLSNVKESRVMVTSTGGNVQLTSVSGPKVSVKTTSGNISYVGEFDGGGSYLLMNHSGDIDVRLPSHASVDLAARSVKGDVENDFPFQKSPHPGFQVSEGRAFAGTSNSGASSVELRSFSGKIRVKKQ